MKSKWTVFNKVSDDSPTSAEIAAFFPHLPILKFYTVIS
jgi:hypothetical protein